MKILMQQADAAAGSQGATAGVAGTQQQQTASTTATGTQTGAAGQQQGTQQQGASASQAGTQQQTSQTQQATDQQQAASADKAKQGATTPIVIKLPDGSKSDPKFVEAFVASATKHGLSQVQAQAVAEFLDQSQASGLKTLEGAFQQQLGKFDETLRADPQFGGTNFDKTTKARDSALKQFGDDDTAKFLEEMGANRHPGFSKMMARIRSLVSDDTVGDKGAKAGAAEETRMGELKRMFPNSPGMWT